jgi:Bifunctional DNA primase/polymerase, N-terminal
LSNLGATLDDWMHFDFVLGLGANLLPCVPASPDVKVLEGSALAGKVGKIPSVFNGRGEAHGLLAWQKRDIVPSEVVEWSKDRRLNMCVRLGPISGIYALDIDVDDREKAEEIVAMIESMLGPLPKRWRENSGKCLLLFRMEGA